MFDRLRAAILSGPLAAQCAPYVILPDAPKDPEFVAKDQAIADLLNAGTQLVTRPLRVEEVFDVLFTSGDWVSIETARLGGNQTAVLCQAGRDALAARASSTVQSSVQTYGRPVTGADVSIALRNL